MAYTKFTEEKLFLDEGVNILLNRIYTALENKFNETSIASNVALSGTVARILNGAAPTDIKVIPIVTTDLKIKNFFSDELTNNIKNVQLVNFNDHVELKFSNVNIELWHITTAIDSTEVSGLVVQNNIAIPSYIL